MKMSSSDVFIYSNGDSFVEGVELGDFILPNYPGGFDFDDIQARNNDSIFRKWYSTSLTHGTDLCRLRNLHRDDIDKENQKKNFTSKLASMLNVDFYNNGKGGASLDRIARTTISDLIELKKRRKNIVAIIGTAEPLRMEMPRPDAPYWEPILPGWPINYSVKMQQAAEYFGLNTLNYHKMIKFYQTIINVQNFCAVNNIKLLWLSHIFIIPDHTPIELVCQNEKDLCNFKDCANFKPDIDMEK